jgi:hypothetical protein
VGVDVHGIEINAVDYQGVAKDEGNERLTSFASSMLYEASPLHFSSFLIDTTQTLRRT